MIVEFFGLSNTGKSVMKRKLESKGHLTGKYEEVSLGRKFGNFLVYFLRHPGKTGYLFLKLNGHGLGKGLGIGKRFKIWKMRNSYLAGVLGKAEHYSKIKEEIFVDEFGLQALFMILHRKGEEKEVRKLLRALPLGGKVVVFKGNDRLRKAAYKKKHPFRPGTLMPGSGIDSGFAREWMKIMRYNFKIVERVIGKDFKADGFGKSIGIKGPKSYRKR